MTVEAGGRVSLERLSAEDFETASIRSAAPSYTSDAPSYHSVIHPDTLPPPYSPPAADSSRAAASSTTATNEEASLRSHQRVNSGPSTVPSRTTFSTQGLPPVPSGPPRRRSADVPSLTQFRIPSWSTIHSNPTARHYHSVAHRRVMAAANSNAAGSFATLRRMVLDRVEEEERTRVRPLEDPYLVGEEAAARARAERLARENTEEVLQHEDRRWDWFLSQSRDWGERDRGFRHFRRGIETSPHSKLARRIGAR
ncbi:hypothetical protein VTK73DRAFT_1670 [Phialemonium thermophilum]|uniref:Uncharacterized protein n=1 Tax=Phialemonium thermophilum TaxID=223376 RepID=A0ABR3X8N7_9PEZI